MPHTSSSFTKICVRISGRSPSVGIPTTPASSMFYGGVDGGMVVVGKCAVGKDDEVDEELRSAIAVLVIEGYPKDSVEKEKKKRTSRRKEGGFIYPPKPSSTSTLSWKKSYGKSSPHLPP